MFKKIYYVDNIPLFEGLPSLDEDGVLDCAQLPTFGDEVSVEVDTIEVGDDDDGAAMPSPRTQAWQAINLEEEPGNEAVVPIYSIKPKFMLEVVAGQTLTFKGVLDVRIEDEYRLKILEAPILGSVLIYLKRIGVYENRRIMGHTTFLTDPKDADLRAWPIRVNSPFTEYVKHGEHFAVKIPLSGQTDISIVFVRLSSHRNDNESTLKSKEAKKMALVFEMDQQPEINAAFPIRVVKVLRQRVCKADADSGPSSGIEVKAASTRKRKTPAPPSSGKRAATIQKVVACVNKMTDERLFALATFLDVEA